MKIEWTKRISEDIVEIMQVRPIASMVNYIVTSNVKDKMDVSEKLDALREHATKMHEDLKEYSVDQIIMTLIIEALISPQLADQKDLKYLFMDLIASEAKVFDADIYNDNAYVKNIRLADNNGDKLTVFGDIALKTNSVKPYELFLYDTAKRDDERLLDIPRVGCFTQEVRQIAIVDKNIGSVCMALTPYEINTMESAVKNASGRVLLLGCGMGYMAYMTSIKEDVSSVTIVEKNQDIIDMMEKVILPQFEQKDKIRIIKADAFDYINGIADGEYDYCHVDIWTNEQDVDTYLLMKAATKKLKSTRVDYRLEEAFTAGLSSYVWIEILKAFTAIHNLSIPEQVSEDACTDEEKRRIKYIHSLVENVEIKTPEHIDYYMNPKNIVRMIDGAAISF